MYTRIFLDPANRCVRSLGNPARPGDSDRKAARRVAPTSGTNTELPPAREAVGRLSSRPLCKIWRAHRSASCDTKWGVPFGVPFFGFVAAMESGSHLPGRP